MNAARFPSPRSLAARCPPAPRRPGALLPPRARRDLVHRRQTPKCALPPWVQLPCQAHRSTRRWVRQQVVDLTDRRWCWANGSTAT